MSTKGVYRAIGLAARLFLVGGAAFIYASAAFLLSAGRALTLFLYALGGEMPPISGMDIAAALLTVSGFLGLVAVGLVWAFRARA